MNVRLEFAQLVRQFLSGRMTNHAYEDRYEALPEDGDEAVNQVYCRLWNEYCDFREHRMGRKHGMTRDGRRVAARWIMFLRSGRPYEYPVYGCLPTLVAIATLGLVRKPDPMTFGDSDVWPYFRRDDFSLDLARPNLLSGCPSARIQDGG
ncbi:hypothetical protein [Rosistilla oblonga]|uniref:hypothetical protein n=1 Tax=Rosistilla oblonga TaxID=2527990 RepID=UPI003A979602